MGGRVHGVVSAGAVSGWDGVDGDAADAAVLRAGSDRRTVLGAVDALRDAASVARSGASVIQAARQLVLGAVNAAEAAGFTVREDLSVTDRQTGGPPASRFL